MTNKIYQIHLAPVAQKQLKKLTQPTRELIFKKLEKLKRCPCPVGAKKLMGMESLYRIRVGDYRVIYVLNNHQLIVLVVKVGHCKEVYRKMVKP